MELKNHIILIISILRIGLLGILIFISQNASSQDFHLSQYDATSQYVNPSMTGFFYGYYRLHGHYRTQWASVASKPFVTNQISYEQSLEPFAVGAQILDYRAGAGNYNVFNFNVSGAYDLALDFLMHHHICFGMQTGFIQKSIDFSKLSFNNQYSTANGGGFNTSLANGESFPNSSIYLFDVSAGATYYYDAHEGRRSDRSEIKFIFGLAVFHINKPNESFFAIPNALPRKLITNVQYRIDVSEQLHLISKIMYMRQGNAQEFTTSFSVHYYLEPETYLIAGPTYRNKDAVISEIGLKRGDFIYLMSYDFNTSTLSPSTYGRGGFETSLTYVPHQAKKHRSCPKF